MTTQKTPYDCYRERLRCLADENWALGTIRAAASEWTQWDASQPWRRCFGRFDPNSHPYASLLLQQPDCSRHLCLIEIFEHKPQEHSRNTIQWRHIDVGWVRLQRFPDDPTLRSLARVVAQQPEAIEVLRYRPAKRCTFRIQKEQSGEPLFGKVFADNRGQAIHREGQDLWNAAKNGDLDFNVAQPERWDQDTLTLWQHPVAGRPLLDQLLADTGPAVAGRIGRAAASITQSGLEPKLRFDGQAQMQRSRKYTLELVKRVPAMQTPLENLLNLLSNGHNQARGNTLKPLHGAPHAHQWLDSGDMLGLVDFDRHCLGDPELDAATFIAEMDFEDRDAVPVDVINASFLDAYQSISGRLDTRLLNTYRAHKRLAKALKAARALRCNGDKKATRHVAFALQIMEQKCA